MAVEHHKVLSNLDGVVSEIQSALTPTPDPSPQGGAKASAFEVIAELQKYFGDRRQDSVHFVNPSISGHGSALPSPLRGGVGGGGLQGAPVVDTTADCEKLMTVHRLDVLAP